MRTSQTLTSTLAAGKANALDLALVLGEPQSNAPAVTPGTYTPDGMPDELTASFYSNDANCQVTDAVQTTGSVTITGAGASYTGTFDLDLRRGPRDGQLRRPAL